MDGGVVYYEPTDGGVVYYEPTDGGVEVEPTDGGVGLVVCVVHFFLTDEYKMAKKGRMTRRRRGHKKSMRRGTRKQQKGGACNPSCGRGYICNYSTCIPYETSNYGPTR